VAPTVNAPSFGLQYTGYIEVPETGIYSFFLLADDGAILSIGDKLVINNDGQHGPIEKSGQVALQKGVHPFALHFIEAGGGFSLDLKYSRGKEPVQKVPHSFFTHN
jgi:hexosaminidase